MTASNGALGSSAALIRISLTVVATSVLLLGCAGAEPDATGTIGSEAVPAELASVAVTDTGADNATEAEAEAGKGEAEEGEAGAGEGESTIPGADLDIGDLPSFAAIDQLLVEFSSCLNGAGANAPTLSLQELLAKLPDLPIDADQGATFSHFYGLDPADPTVEAALSACDHLFDDPAVSMFIPAE